jgi:ParB-like nuclease domain
VTESPEPDPHTRTPGDEAGGQMSGQVREIAIADITIPPTKRALKEESVEQIMTSMPEFGLGGTPLTVYRGEEADKFVLITGGHRLEAARRLGGTVIAANIVDWNQIGDACGKSSRTYIGPNSRSWNAPNKLSN